ncbi:MAG: SGNH/GDSL hydrolase family protein [Litoreibacter sp.]|nr:SGNH/GDSL hydrolase family protein [Litoreibacter sp.]MCY4334510.1 SGNH/GDSL hydrolase family protein [Litoreibacter sp.]
MQLPRLHARFHPEIAVKFALFPYLVAQGAWLRRTALQLPEPTGPRAGVEGKGPVLRLLLLGDSSAAGVGVDHQQQALSGQLSLHLAPHVTLDWVFDAKTGRTSRQMFKRLVKIPASQYDVAVTALGVNDITKRASRENWLEDTELMWDLLRSKFGVRHIYASGIPRIADFPLLPPVLRWILSRQGLRYDAGLEELSAKRPDVTHMPSDMELHGLMSSDGFHPGPEVYAHWAKGVAAQILSDLPAYQS